jgi:hypothetical protein
MPLRLVFAVVSALGGVVEVGVSIGVQKRVKIV